MYKDLQFINDSCDVFVENWKYYKKRMINIEL